MYYIILAAALAVSLIIIAYQNKIIRHQRERLADALEWIDPVAVKAEELGTPREFWD